jgi:hypothetical protein
VHIPDLSTNGYVASGDALRSVGWLEIGHEFPTGSSSAEFISALHGHLANPFGVWYFMGSHECELCPPDQGPSGNGELYIPTAKLCYVAPLMIAHYVDAHNYKPPQEFVDALLECPPQSSAAYIAIMAPFLPCLMRQAGPN